MSLFTPFHFIDQKMDWRIIFLSSIFLPSMIVVLHMMFLQEDLCTFHSSCYLYSYWLQCHHFLCLCGVYLITIYIYFSLKLNPSHDSNQLKGLFLIGQNTFYTILNHLLSSSGNSWIKENKSSSFPK